MASKSAVERLLNPKAYGRGINTPPAPIPEIIRLPNGQTHSVRELLESVTAAKSITLSRPRGNYGRRYTEEDKDVIINGDLNTIMARFSCDEDRARNLKKAASRRQREMLAQASAKKP